MTHNTVPLPEPVSIIRTTSGTSVYIGNHYTPDQLQAYAAAVSAAKDAEIERLRDALRSIDLDARVSRPYVGQVSRLGELSRAALKETK
jgi:hypothetical protein